ncbi:MAG: OmpA family protein [Deltaproteobacteria bacterium]|nr:OmpA family protein [Deltaproteobacteria bacterium]
MSTIYVAVGPKTASEWEQFDDGDSTTGGFRRDKTNSVFQIDSESPFFSSLSQWIMEKKPQTRIRGGFRDLSNQIFDPGQFTATMTLDLHQAEWLKGILGSDAQIVSGDIEGYETRVSYTHGSLTDEQRMRLSHLRRALEGEDLLRKFDGNVAMLNLYEFAKIEGTDKHDFLGRKLRSFLPRLAFYGQIGAANGVLELPAMADGTGAIRLALHECNPDLEHYNDECVTESDGDSGLNWDYNGPNQWLLGGGLAGNLWNRMPAESAEALSAGFTGPDAGVQIYGFAEINGTGLFLEDREVSFLDVGGGVGVQTDLVRLYDDADSTLVLFPGMEFFLGGSFAYGPGSVAALRPKVLGWYHDDWGVEAILQGASHDWEGGELDNTAFNLGMFGDNETLMALLRFRFDLYELNRDVSRAPDPDPRIVAPVCPPAPVVEAPPLIRQLVISLPDILFMTNEPTEANASRENIFEPQEMNLRALSIIAQKLNGEDLRNYRIRIVGHTDGRGEDDFNNGLSLRRADAVREALIGLGVDADRLTTEGKGEGVPKIPEDFDAGTEDLVQARRINRRIEFAIEGTIEKTEP